MSRVCGNGKRRRKMFHRLARKTAEALMPPLASRSRRNPPYGTTFDQNGPASSMRWMRLPFWQLWDKYAVIVSHFEPTKRWEEAALVFSFIQASGGKPVVQYQLVGAGTSRRGVAAVAEPDFFLDPPTGRPAPRSPKRKAAIIQFRPHRSPREGCLRRARRKRLRPQENRFFRPIHVDDPAEPL